TTENVLAVGQLLTVVNPLQPVFLYREIVLGWLQRRNDLPRLAHVEFEEVQHAFQPTMDWQMAGTFLGSLLADLAVQEFIPAKDTMGLAVGFGQPVAHGLDTAFCSQVQFDDLVAHQGVEDRPPGLAGDDPVDIATLELDEALIVGLPAYRLPVD